MNRRGLMVSIAIAASLLAAAGGVATQGAHKFTNTGDIKWGPQPPGLPAGAQVAVLEGDPAKAGEPFVLRVKAPDGYKVAPHWHPTDEYITIFSGTMMMGVGDKADASKMHAMNAGAFGKMPKKTNHYVTVKGETVFQVHGIGPFEITYVDPKDDPRKKTSTP